MARRAGPMIALLFLAHAAAAQFTQQGGPLTGTGAVGPARQGSSVAISADGTTAIVGGVDDNSSAGAAWVYTRIGGVWSQQGSKLVGTGAVGAAAQGTSVAISGDGSTAIGGGPRDSSNTGAAWVFTRNGGVWSQQGTKLVGMDTVGAADQGFSVAISGDGNTAIVGGWNDASRTGAAWVYTRSGGVWSQQGSKLVGNDATAFFGAEQGWSVAISADGNTAIVGGPLDTLDTGPSVGAAWVYTRSGGIWSQQGSKLVGTGAVGAAQQGQSVAISAGGATAIVGGWHDNSLAGAVWVFTRSGEVLSQQGSKLVGAGAVGAAQQGYSVAISADGSTAIVGGPYDNSDIGAAWVFVAGGCTSPSITAQPLSQSIQSGQSAALSVAATGDMPLTYQWYQGSSGDTSNPVGSNTSSFATPALTVDTSYWVRVSNSCGQTDSATATITVGTGNTTVVWVPVASHVSGLNSSEWRSDLGLLNTAMVTANVQIEFFGTSVVSDTISVAPGAQSLLTDVVGQLGASGSGALEILSDQPLKVTARTYNQVPSDASCYPNGTQGGSYPALAAGDGLGAGQSAYLAGLVENASYRCNIGVVNTGTGSATGLVELYNGAGTYLASYPVSLAAGQWVQPAQPFLNVAGQTAMDSGYARITVQTGSGVFAFASVIDNITNDPTTIAMQESALASVVWVPVASHVSGLNGSEWRSDLGLLNTTAVTANVQIEFFGTSVVSDTISVAPGAQSLLTDVVGQLGASGSGALEILSDQPLKVTARTYNQVPSDASCYPNGTQGGSYPALAAGDGLGAGQSAYLAGLVENASYRCNIGVVNTGTGSATGLVELYNGAGTYLASYPVSLAAGQWVQPAQPFLNVAGQTAMDSGYARITVQTGSGVFAFASVIDNITNDPTTIAMQR